MDQDSPSHIRLEELAQQKLPKTVCRAIAKIELTVTEDEYVEINAKIQTKKLKKLRKIVGAIILFISGLVWSLKSL